MYDVSDPAIKLFGKTIPVAGDGDGDDNVFDGPTFSDQLDILKDGAEEESMKTEQPDDASPPTKESSRDPPATAKADENQKESDSDKDSVKDTESPKCENDSNESKNFPQKTLKKPDKILPCPRCNSVDTKFCYYNNYNINQPRHFCKSCQRYWTAGGTMRNVPVGAGRRKNKTSVSRYCHITVSEALQVGQLDVPNGVLHPGLKPNGTVLTFGAENPHCESVASVINLAEKKISNVQKSKENDDHSTASTITSSSMDDGVKKVQDEATQPHLNGFTAQMPCFQWPYMWNPAVPAPPFCPSSFPVPIYPAPYWNGAIPWNIPAWVAQYSPGFQGQKSSGSNSSSPTLGKHSRDGETHATSNNEKGSKTTTVLVPKTLRIDNPDDAAKSSIWTTLGIKIDKGDHTSKGGFFNNFQTKAEEKDKKMEASPALQANPAALCRSIRFQESAKR